MVMSGTKSPIIEPLSQENGPFIGSPLKGNNPSLKNDYKRKIEFTESKSSKRIKKEETQTNSGDGLSISKKRKFEKLEKLKSRNPAADFITQCNVLYNALLNTKNDSTDERQQKVQDCLTFIDSFDIQSSDAFAGKARLLGVNRCLQMCYKFGSPSQKTFMTEKLESHFLQMATKDTGMHLCQKMLKYSDEETKKSLIDKLVTETNLDFFYSKFGSTVLSVALSSNDAIASSFRKQLLLRLCIPKIISIQMPNVVSMTALTVYWKSDDRGKKQIKENLEKVISRCVNKELVDRSYFHEVFDFFSFIATTDELRSMLESLRECLPLLLSTRNGCLTICRLLNVAEAKLRKKFISSCRDASIRFPDIAFSSVSCIVVFKLLSCVDDTKLLREFVLSPILNFDVKSLKPKEKENGSTLINLVKDRSARKVLLMLFCNDYCRYFNEEEKQLILVSSPASKKDPEVRRMELIDFASKVFRYVVMNQTDHNEFIDTWINNREARDVFVEYLRLTKDVEVMDKLFESLELFKSDNRLIDLFDHQTGQRTFINLLRVGISFKPMTDSGSDQITEKVSKDDLLKNSEGQTFHEYLDKLICGILLPKVLNTRGIFVIVDLYTIIKKLGLKSSDEIEQFSKSCQRFLSQLKSQDTSGVRLLKSRLS